MEPFLTCIYPCKASVCEKAHRKRLERRRQDLKGDWTNFFFCLSHFLTNQTFYCQLSHLAVVSEKHLCLLFYRVLNETAAFAASTLISSDSHFLYVFCGFGFCSSQQLLPGFVGTKRKSTGDGIQCDPNAQFTPDARVLPLCSVK